MLLSDALVSMKVQWNDFYERRCTRLTKMLMFILLLYSIAQCCWQWLYFAGLLIRINLYSLSFDCLGVQGCWSGSIWLRFHLIFWVLRVADPDPLGSPFIWLSGFSGLLIRIHLDLLSFDFLGWQGCDPNPLGSAFIWFSWVFSVAVHDPFRSAFIWFSGFAWLLIRIYWIRFHLPFWVGLQDCWSGSTWIRFHLTFWF